MTAGVVVAVWIVAQFDCYAYSYNKAAIAMNLNGLSLSLFTTQPNWGNELIASPPVRGSIGGWWLRIAQASFVQIAFIPYWMFLLPCLVASVVAWRSKPLPPYLCKQCDYNLRFSSKLVV
jgi:hypothetical protein